MQPVFVHAWGVDLGGGLGGGGGGGGGEGGDGGAGILLIFPSQMILDIFAETPMSHSGLMTATHKETKIRTSANILDTFLNYLNYHIDA